MAFVARTGRRLRATTASSGWALSLLVSMVLAGTMTSCSDPLPSLAKRDASAAEPGASAAPPPRFVAVRGPGDAGLGGKDAQSAGSSGGAAPLGPPVPITAVPPEENTPVDLEARRDWSLSLLHGIADVESARFCLLSSLSGDQPGSWLTVEPLPVGGLAYGETVVIGGEDSDAPQLQNGALRVYVVAGEAAGGSVPSCAALLPEVRATEWQLRSRRGGRAVRWDTPQDRGGPPEGGAESQLGLLRDASVVDASVVDASVVDASVVDADAWSLLEAATDADAGTAPAGSSTRPPLLDGGLAPVSLEAALRLQPDGGSVFDTAKILPLVEFASGTLKEELSRLLVVSGCFRGPGPDSSTSLVQGRLVCGPDYGRRPTTLTPVFVRLTRRVKLGKVALQAVNAVPSAAMMTLRSDPQNSDGLLLTLGQEQRFGTIQPQSGFTSASFVQLGPVDESTLDLTLAFGEEPRLSQLWADALWVSGLEELEDGRAYTLVSVGPQPGLDHDVWFNPTFITVVDNDPLRE